MDFDEMRKAVRNAFNYGTEEPQYKKMQNELDRMRTEVYKFPTMTVSYLIEKDRLEHILNTAPEAVMERPTPNIKEFAEKTKMGIPEVAFTGWEQLLNFMKEYDRMTHEVNRLSSLLNKQRNEVISILQGAIDQISRQLRESTMDERTPDTTD